ncbi:ArsR/SmtB family transcription factor [Taibaiella soli]|nr:helix-turn-helix transcriptional regulator [Taibaiella soli]
MKLVSAYFLRQNLHMDSTHSFTKYQNDLAGIARVIAHPARIAILQYLSAVHDASFDYILDDLELEPEALGVHLKELENSGFIRKIKQDEDFHYFIDTLSWNKCKEILMGFFKEVPKNNNRCD